MTHARDAEALQVVVLAAGFGSRLGGAAPKALTRLDDGRTILRRALDQVRGVVPGAAVHVVVGFKASLVMEAQPDVLYVYNEAYDTTNTSKSLLRALELCPDGPVLWLNGDVVFDAAVLVRVLDAGARGLSAVAVDTRPVGDEEVAYTLDDAGLVARLAKGLPGARGEAVGINLVSRVDRAALTRRLAEVADGDYFERAMERAIADDGARFVPVDVSDLHAVEVDFPEDLRRANEVTTSAVAGP